MPPCGRWSGSTAVLRSETRTRARALQLLYAWELRGRPQLADVAAALVGRYPGCRSALERAEPLAQAVVSHAGELDARIGDAAEHWRLARIGVIERSILRLGLHEVLAGAVPVRVAITEAVRLAHWFAGAKAPPFVNGVLDALARQAGRL